MASGERALWVFPTFFTTLVPDLYSVASYFRIKRHAKEQQEEEEKEEELPYGGIYVGEKKVCRKRTQGLVIWWND